MHYTKEVLETSPIKEVKRKRIGSIKIRKATIADIDGIYNVASSVGKGKKNQVMDFLMDNYSVNPDKHKNTFKEKAEKLKFFLCC